VPQSWTSRDRNRLRPNSPAAYSFAVLCVAAATLLRIVFGFLDTTLPFVTYFPFVLICTLLAGYQAGVFSVALSVLIVWWIWVPPQFSFALLSVSDAVNLVLFAASAALIVWVAHRYRVAVDLFRATERERELAMKELEHRGKNTFAVVESIVRRTLDDLPERADIIAGRIHSVSSTNDIINRAPAHKVGVRAIFENEFAAHGPGRFTGLAAMSTSVRIPRATLP
jgi:K+-sensing histidine kinase KdpD